MRKISIALVAASTLALAACGGAEEANTVNAVEDVNLVDPLAEDLNAIDLNATDLNAVDLNAVDMNAVDANTL